MEERQTVYQQRRPVASHGMRRDSSASQWSTTAVIATSKCSSEDIVSETHPSRRHCQTLEGPGVAETVFSVPDSKDFVLDFSGRLSGSQQCLSRRRRDVLRSKRMLLRRKRKSTDLPKEGARIEDEACVLPIPDPNVHLGGDACEKTRRLPLDKAWVDRVDETSRHNPLLAIDVSFRLRRSTSKPGLVWKLSRFCAERGDSLRNLLFTRHEQVAVAETARPDQSELGKPKKHGDGSSPSEDNEKSRKGDSDKSQEKQRESSSQAQDADPIGEDENDQPGGQEGVADASRTAGAAGQGAEARVTKSHEHGSRARELEAIIMEEKEKAKDLRAAVLLALTYGASFGAAAAYGASNANDYFKKYIEMNVKLPSATLNVYMWLLVHVPFCFALMIIAARIIYYVHTRNYDVMETATAPKSNVVIRDRLHIMGQVSYGEYISAFLVGTAMVLLIFREPTFMKYGWGDWLGIEREVTDASVGIIVGMLAFLFPADILPEAHQTQIIEWADMLKRLPWGVIFILGSSSTVTTAIENNGVYKMLEEKLFNLALPPFYHQYISVLIMGCFGELTTFKSRLRHFTRIGYRISRKLRRDPLFFLLPVSMVCQLSLILPSASPNNAMAFELGSMTSLQMIVPGFITKALTIVLYMTLIDFTVSPNQLSDVQGFVNGTSGLASGDPDAVGVAIDVAQVAFE
ncbi:solute carrier family 13 member 2 [Dermacentor silvarum]|uniref:solute carrier family 13 member 2 n=1 Tax=Dermacentor silvarum TaxID=543639 RepID=UPI002100A0D9|nr:solute carrier family 13 member 2 [Dermacentor silvarum]